MSDDTASTSPSPTAARQRASAALLRLCARNPFFGALALFARLDLTERVLTAATDGKDIFVNPSFFMALGSQEQEAVLLHEVLHAALLHVPRRRERDARLWNIAGDIVINGMLAHEGYQLPLGAVRDEALEHLSTEEVFELLRAGHAHAGAPCGGLLGHGPEEGGLGGAGTLSEERRDALEGYWRNALQEAGVIAQGQQMGRLPASLSRELAQISAAELDWRSYLWRFLVQTPIDFSGFDRRFIGRRVYLEQLEGETVQVFVAVDTSGSIDDVLLRSFVAEVQAILGAYPHLRCQLYFVDAEAHGPYQLQAGDQIPPPVGGGGTDFRPFFERVEREQDQWSASVAVYLTDGYGEFPEQSPSLPVLWVVTPGGLDNEQFPFGEQARLGTGI